VLLRRSRRALVTESTGTHALRVLQQTIRRRFVLRCIALSSIICAPVATTISGRQILQEMRTRCYGVRAAKPSIYGLIFVSRQAAGLHGARRTQDVTPVAYQGSPADGGLTREPRNNRSGAQL